MKACVLSIYCPKGSLQDVLENDNIKLDQIFKVSFASDIATVTFNKLFSCFNLKIIATISYDHYELGYDKFSAISNIFLKTHYVRYSRCLLYLVIQWVFFIYIIDS